jgi:hypothetical protein
MAVGDRITSARTAGFMRRINALELLHDWTVDEVTISGTLTTPSTLKIIDTAATFQTDLVHRYNTATDITDGGTTTVNTITSETEVTVFAPDLFGVTASVGDQYEIDVPYSINTGGIITPGPVGDDNDIFVYNDSSTVVERYDKNLNYGASPVSIISDGTAAGSLDFSEVRGWSYNKETQRLWVCDIPLLERIIVGTTDGATTTDKLIDSTASFTSTVAVGTTIKNTTDVTQATVDSVDSDTQLTLSADIMATGEDYVVSQGYGRIQKFQRDGTLVFEYTDPFFELKNPIGTDNGGCIIKFDGGAADISIKSISSAEAVVNIITIDPSTASAGDPLDIVPRAHAGGDIVACSVAIHSQFGECRDYNHDGTLEQTTPQPTWYNATTNESDSYTTPVIIFANGDRMCVDMLTSGTTTAAIQMVSKSTGAFRYGFDFAAMYSPNVLSSVSSQGVVPTLSDSTGRLFGYGEQSHGTTSRVSEGSTQTTWYRYPTPGNDTGKATLGTVDYGASVPADAALSGYRPHYFELRDMRTAIESVAVNYYKPVTFGVTDGTTTSKLVDAGSSFTTIVTVGDIVLNTTDGTATTVSAIDSDTVLSLADDIFVSGEIYIIKTNLVVSGSVNNNLFTLALGGGLTDWTTPTVTHTDRIRETDYSDIGTILTYLEGGSLA